MYHEPNIGHSKMFTYSIRKPSHVPTELKCGGTCCLQVELVEAALFFAGFDINITPWGKKQLVLG